MTTAFGLHAFGFAILAISIIFAALILGTSRAPWMVDTLLNQAFLGFSICEIMSLVLLLISLVLINR